MIGTADAGTLNGKQLKRRWKGETRGHIPLKVWARRACPADFERWMGRKRAW